MKKTIVYLAAFLLILSGMSFTQFNKIRPEGKITKVNINEKSFTAISVASGIQLFLTQGEQSIVVEAYENIHEVLDVFVEKNTLKIQFKKKFNIQGKHDTKVYVSTPNIHSIIASGGSKVQIENGLRVDNLSVVISGGGSIAGDLSSKEVSIALSGGGHADMQVESSSLSIIGSGGSRFILSGEAAKGSLVLSGGSRLQGEKLSIDRLNATISGGGTAKLNVQSDISCTLSGGSKLLYKGNPSIDKLISSGGSKIQKED